MPLGSRREAGFCPSPSRVQSPTTARRAALKHLRFREPRADNNSALQSTRIWGPGGGKGQTPPPRRLQAARGLFPRPQDIAFPPARGALGARAATRSAKGHRLRDRPRLPKAAGPGCPARHRTAPPAARSYPLAPRRRPRFGSGNRRTPCPRVTGCSRPCPEPAGPRCPVKEGNGGTDTARALFPSRGSRGDRDEFRVRKGLSP